MVQCSKCHKVLGVFSKKYKLEDGSVLCDSCYKKWEEKRKKTIKEYINKYLSSKEPKFVSLINAIVKNINEDRELASLFSRDSIQKAIEYYEKSIDNLNYYLTRRLSKSEREEVIEQKDLFSLILVFLQDLEKMYKLLTLKKNIETDFYELLSLFEQSSEENIDKSYEDFAKNIYDLIKKQVGKSPNVRTVVKETVKLQIYFAKENGEVLDEAWLDSLNELLPKVLNKFGLEYDEDEIKEMVPEVLEEIELEDFEQGLD